MLLEKGHGSRVGTADSIYRPAGCTQRPNLHADSLTQTSVIQADTRRFQATVASLAHVITRASLCNHQTNLLAYHHPQLGITLAEVAHLHVSSA